MTTPPDTIQDALPAELDAYLAGHRDVVDLEAPAVQAWIRNEIGCPWEGRGSLLEKACMSRKIPYGKDGLAVGVLRRLEAGLRSLTSHRDGNVTWEVVELPCQLDDYERSQHGHGARRYRVRAWSDGGCWTRRRWDITTTLRVSWDEYGELAIVADPAEPETVMWVSTAGRDRAYDGRRQCTCTWCGGHVHDPNEDPRCEGTTFRSPSGWLAGDLAIAWRGYLAREAIRTGQV